jgi:wyosine [tRNA(Phe)-imidazoG37] synthetase (radical SAM superfamily)
VLPLWTYAGLAVIDGGFHVPAIRIDDDPRSDPGIHGNRKELKRAIERMIFLYPENRLVRQLARCSTEYNCLCSRNFFLGRYEAPVPTSTACNARCPGCLSYQDAGSGTVGSQDRLDFLPSPEEIAQVILHHVTGVENSVVSFGQGCEGEPLLRGKDLSRAISLVRGKTGKGTINLNTNGSLPDAVRLLINSGLDSIRISLNSPTEKYYERYFRGQGFTFNDVKRSLAAALDSGIFFIFI